MNITFNCPNCGQYYNVSEESAGKTIKCIECKIDFLVPLTPAPSYLHQSYPPQYEYLQQDMEQDSGMRMLLPIGRSGFAIAAGYLGLFSITLFPAPFAIIFGILAIKDIKKHPEKHGLGRAYFGIFAGILAISIFLLNSMGVFA